MIVLGKTEEEIKAILDNVCREHVLRFWGSDHTITPVLIEEVHGDGMQLVYFTALATRPNSYVLRIDSNILISENFEDNDKSLSEKDKAAYREVGELLMTMIENRWGNVESERENDEDEMVFPALNDSCGFGYGSLSNW